MVVFLFFPFRNTITKIIKIEGWNTLLLPITYWREKKNKSFPINSEIAIDWITSYKKKMSTDLKAKHLDLIIKIHHIIKS